MPKRGPPLSAAETAVLRNWIEKGVDWPETVVLRERAKADRSWWSLQPITAVKLSSPPGLPKERAVNPIVYGQSPHRDEVDRASALVEQHGLRSLCRALLNSNELSFVR